MSSRRGLLAGGAVGAGVTVAAGVLGAPTAHASTSPYSYSRTSAPDEKWLHFMNRLGCGYSRGTTEQMAAAGGPEAWFEQQLRPESVTESPMADALSSWFPDLADSPSVRYDRVRLKARSVWDYARDLANQTKLRRIHSNRQVLENLVDLWSNHLHVQAMSSPAWVQRTAYDQVIRRHALGRFEDMLVDATLHPAMLMFLDNYRSTRTAPSENHARELLELHTVGRASGYSEDMVKSSAKILSGWTVAVRGSWEAWYDPGRHSTGAVQVLGFTAENSSTDGRELVIGYLKYLANHPATAHNIARKLCRRFVADDPSTDIVNTVAQTYRSSGTDIKACLRALVAHPDFLVSRGQIVRDPIEDFVATCRVLGVTALKPTRGTSFANKAYQATRATPLYQWPTPDGAPMGAQAWVSPGRMLNSFRMHWQLAAGWQFTDEVVYRRRAEWLPEPSVSLGNLVDHLCKLLLGRPSTSLLLDAVVLATGFQASTVVTSSHALCRSHFPRLVGALLDTPDHLSR